MFAERFTILVEKLSVRSLQRPGEFRSVTLAAVDLVALRMDLEKKLFVCGRLELLRDFLRGNRERKDRAQGCEQRGGSESANAVVHGRIPSVKAQLGFEVKYNSPHRLNQNSGRFSRLIGQVDLRLVWNR